MSQFLLGAVTLVAQLFVTQYVKEDSYGAPSFCRSIQERDWRSLQYTAS
jgi:hypothetical protein